MPDELEILAERLRASADYRVLRRLQQPSRYCEDGAPLSMRRALLVDVETTGLSYHADVIIELGVILFTYNANTGEICEVLRAESWLEDPGRPIPEAVVQLTGISDDDVRGQRIDDDTLREMADGVTLIIAHNAAFDRPFIDRRLPFLADTHWGCSMHDVPWHSRHRGSFKLDYLLYLHTNTFLDTHHRALDDCRATLHVLATAFENDETPMQLLLANCRAQRVRIGAVNSPFETKDALRKRGYSWSGNEGRPPKTWCREIPASDVEAETAWLREQVYGNAAFRPHLEKIDLRRRYAAS